MKFIFRVDASIEMGTGHVMRCLTLADTVTLQGAVCYFICREHRGNLIDLIKQRGYQVYILPLDDMPVQSNNSSEDLKHSSWLGAVQEEDAILCTPIIKSIQPEWVIIDHYALDFRWEKMARNYCKKIMVIDDLADRKHDCDILLDQTLGRDSYEYSQLVPKSCELLCGSNYALLRPEFAYWRQYSLRRRSSRIDKVLINLGGVDKENITATVLKCLRGSLLHLECQIIVVMGQTAPWIEDVRLQASLMPWKTEVKVGVENMAELMANSDLAIGAAGSTSWERCCLGLPTIMLVLADNQLLAAEMLENENAVIKLNVNEDIKSRIKDIINNFHNTPSLLNKLSLCSRAISDGSGSELVLKRLKVINEN